MADGDFDHRASACCAVRTFRLHHPLPVVAEFFATRYSIDLYEMPYTAGGEHLRSCLPWQAIEDGWDLNHAGLNVIKRNLATGMDVRCGSLAEVLFLRLVRQGDAEELAGPHCKVPRN